VGEVAARYLLILLGNPRKLQLAAKARNSMRILQKPITVDAARGEKEV
jgi:hypothetical protein